MRIELGGGKTAKWALGYDEVALVPGLKTLDPADVSTAFDFCGHTFKFPIIASSMDSAVNPRMAGLFHKYGGLAVINLQGVQTRFEDPEAALDRIRREPVETATALMQEIYTEPIKEDLIGRRISEIKAEGSVAAVGVTPMVAAKFLPAMEEAGVDIIMIQSTVTSPAHESSQTEPLDLKKYCSSTDKPVVIGNCVSEEVAYELMKCGAAGILVGIGPGQACTSRGVLGIGVPQITATAECAAARNRFFKETGRYVSVVTDGGIAKGGEVVKSIAAGGDAVMMGSPFAKAEESPGGGFHWGMATPDPALPRGTRVTVDITGTLEQILLGPARKPDGYTNLVGALRVAMGMVGARTLKELQQAELVFAPAFMSEGKFYQKSQKVGMGR